MKLFLAKIRPESISLAGYSPQSLLDLNPELTEADLCGLVTPGSHQSLVPLFSAPPLCCHRPQGG